MQKEWLLSLKKSIIITKVPRFFLSFNSAVTHTIYEIKFPDDFML